MKKNLLITLIGAITLLGFSACTKNEIIEQINPNRTIWHTIRATDWVADSQNDRWFVEIGVSQIDDWIVDYGTVLVDISFGDGVFEPLTTVYNGLAYRYDYSLGVLLIDVSYADGFGGNIDRPGAANIKIILIDSEGIN